MVRSPSCDLLQRESYLFIHFSSNTDVSARKDPQDLMNIKIRQEHHKDFDQVFELNKVAFGRENESKHNYYLSTFLYSQLEKVCIFIMIRKLSKH